MPAHGSPYQNESSAVPILCTTCGDDCSAYSYSLVGFPGRAWCVKCFQEPMTEPRPSNWNPGEPPAQPLGTQRDPAQVLATFRTNLEWAIDCASLKLNRLKPGSSAFKTQAGLVRGLQEALGGLKSEMGA